MKPVRIVGALPDPLNAPADWTEDNGRCGRLFIRVDIEQGVPFMKSAWEAEPEDALLLLGGAKVILGISGNRHPVVNLGVAQLPEDFAPVVTARQFAALDGTAAIRVDMLFDAHGGRRGFCEVRLDGRTYAEAVEHGIDQIVVLARREGWVAESWGKR
jgi:hypothetical protein